MIDIEDALNLLEAVVKDGGEETRADAWYVNPLLNQPVCMIGRAMSYAGIDTKTMLGWGRKPIQDVYEEGLIPEEITLGAVLVLRAAQMAQDGHIKAGQHIPPVTWGEALSEALRAAERYLDLIPEAALPKQPLVAIPILVGV